MTAAELLAWATQALGKAREGLPNPAREARWLLARLLGVDEVWLLAHVDEDVAPASEARFRHWITRRRAGEPAHYLTGSCPFWGRDFLATPAVLVPRPETELLIATALTLPLPASPAVLDVGTGSGCLAVTLAAAWPDATVYALDLSLSALAVARANACRHRVRLHLLAADLTLPLRARFHLVVANLPYLPDGDITALPPEVSRFEPRLALSGGADGAELLRRLVADLDRLLAPGGHALLEIGPEQHPLLEPVRRAAGLERVALIPDAAGIARVLQLRAATGGG